jgi:hypothetical protein
MPCLKSYKLLSLPYRTRANCTRTNIALHCPTMQQANLTPAFLTKPDPSSPQGAPRYLAVPIPKPYKVLDVPTSPSPAKRIHTEPKRTLPCRAQLCHTLKGQTATDLALHYRTRNHLNRPQVLQAFVLTEPNTSPPSHS